ncbi:MAG: hypothetical protein OEM02_10000 [Desulfobulbaceae bacterium]|nr:hypothetical protein [Desulfobulbaceae bacterium]
MTLQNIKHHCSAADPCQQARKTAWHRSGLKTDSEYKAGQRLSQEKWQLNNPNYWHEYRANNSQKAYRNRDLQRVRNRRRKEKSRYYMESVNLIAKMDTRKIFRHVVKGYYE